MLSQDQTLQDVDFDILTAKEMRDVLKSKAHCLRAGFPKNHVIIQTLNEFRDHYVSRVGLPTYLSQMLGELGNTPMEHCKLFTEDGTHIKLRLNGAHNQPVQRFLGKNFLVDELPFRIQVQLPSNPDRTDERYL